MIKNPLRYPGAKSKLVPYVRALLEINALQGSKFVEPFAGSASVGLALLEQRLINSLIIVEKDVLLYAFWHCVMNKAEALCEMIKKTPVNIEMWHAMDRLRKDSVPISEDHLLELGYAGLFYNRTNFSGILKANPLGGLMQTSKYAIDCRFNKVTLVDSIMKLNNFSSSVSVIHADALEYLENAADILNGQNTFTYVDPPYHAKGKQLYRHYFSDIEHARLSKIIKHRLAGNWLISYDDSPFIRGLYNSGHNFQHCYFDYTVSTNRTRVEELLISNLHLPPTQVFWASTS